MAAKSTILGTNDNICRGAAKRRRRTPSVQEKTLGWGPGDLHPDPVLPDHSDHFHSGDFGLLPDAGPKIVLFAAMGRPA